MIDWRRFGPEYAFDKCHALANGNRRQVDPVSDVAHGINRRHAGLAVGIHLDLTATAQRHAHLLQPHVSRIRVTSGRKKHRIKHTLRPVAGLDPERPRAIRFPCGGPLLHSSPHRGIRHGACMAQQMIFRGRRHLKDVRSRLQHDTALSHGFRNQPARLVIKAAQDLGAAVVLRYFNAQSVHDTCKFTRNIATADNQQGTGQVRQIENIVRHQPKMRIRNIWPHWAATGGHKDMPGCSRLAARQLHCVRIQYACALIECLHTR